MTELAPAVHEEIKVDAVEDTNVAPASIEVATPDQCEQSRADRGSDQGEAMDGPISSPAAVDTVTPTVPVPGEPITARSPVPTAGGSVGLSGMPILSTQMPSLTSYNSKIGSFKPLMCNVKGIGLPASCTPAAVTPVQSNTQHMIRRPLLGNNLAAPGATLSFIAPVLKTTANSVSSTISGPMIPQSGSVTASAVSRPLMSTPMSRGSGPTNAAKADGKELVTNSKFSNYVDTIQTIMTEQNNTFLEIFRASDDATEVTISKFQVAVAELNEKLNDIGVQIKTYTEEENELEPHVESEVEPVQDKTGDEGNCSNDGSANIQPRSSQTSNTESIEKNE